MEISSLLEAFKLRVTFWFAALLALGFLALAPEAWINSLGLTEFMKEYRQWAALGFIIAAGVLASSGLAALWRIFRSDVKWHLISKKRHRSRLLSLSPEEKMILGSYIVKDTKTLHAHPSNGVFGGLEAANVIFRSSTIGSPGMTFPYNIQPWAWDCLIKEPELIGLSAEDIETARALVRQAQEDE